MTTAYIITGDGNISLTHNSNSHTIGKDHLNYQQILDALNAETFEDLDNLVDIPVVIAREITGVTVNDLGQVIYNGVELHGVIAKRITHFVREGLPYKPLLRFLENLMGNPSMRAVNELYTFLENGGYPITPDGCFIAYKGIKEDWMDCYSGSFDNSIGNIVEMPRNEVDDDNSNTCSYGFHVGSYSYATSFSKGHTVLVKVNPADAVSVPADHGAEKLRVCRYEVIEEAGEQLDDGLFRQSSTEVDRDTSWDDDEDDGTSYDMCDECLEYEEDCVCDDDDEGEGDYYGSVESSTGRSRGAGGRFLPNN